MARTGLDLYDDRYPLINHKYLHYGLVTSIGAWSAGVDGPECVILMTGAGSSVTLPNPADFIHQGFYVKNANAGGVIFVNTNAGELIDGGPNVSASLNSNEAALFVSDGTGWWILAFYAAAFPLPP